MTKLEKNEKLVPIGWPDQYAISDRTVAKLIDVLINLNTEHDNKLIIGDDDQIYKIALKDKFELREDRCREIKCRRSDIKWMRKLAKQYGYKVKKG